MQDLLATTNTRDGEALNIFAALVRNPGLFDKWVRFGG